MEANGKWGDNILIFKGVGDRETQLDLPENYHLLSAFSDKCGFFSTPSIPIAIFV